MLLYNKLLNPLLLFVGVGDCRGQCPGIGVANRPIPCMCYGIFKKFKIFASEHLSMSMRRLIFFPTLIEGVVHGV